MLLVHCVRRAASRALCTAGRRSETRMPMMAITTSSSTSVKPLKGTPCGRASIGSFPGRWNFRGELEIMLHLLPLNIELEAAAISLRNQADIFRLGLVENEHGFARGLDRVEIDADSSLRH